MRRRKPQDKRLRRIQIELDAGELVNTGMAVNLPRPLPMPLNDEVRGSASGNLWISG